MFRPVIKVIDCTVRDGGLMNKWKFADEFVRHVYQALTEAAISGPTPWMLSRSSSLASMSASSPPK